MKYIKHINESLPASMQEAFTFVTTINKREVDLNKSSLPVIDDKVVDKDAYLESSDFKVEWEADFDLKKWGIGNFAPHFKRCWGTYTIVTPTDRDDVTEDVDFDTSTSGSEWNISLDNDSDVKFNTGIAPQSIELNFHNKTVIVKF